MRSRTVRALVVAMGAVFVVLVVAPAAFAHPLGNFTVNRGSAIRLTVGLPIGKGLVERGTEMRLGLALRG